MILFSCTGNICYFGNSSWNLGSAGTLGQLLIVFFLFFFFQIFISLFHGAARFSIPASMFNIL